MNYRHAFHAGNAADCLKHAVLHWMVLAMRRKDKPFLVLDTHAGVGQYDLGAGPALRTGEAAGGILRLMDDPPAALAAYVALVRELGLYPGSPAIMRAMLRDGDRAICCELHPEDHAGLRRLLGRDARMAVHLRDGYEAVGAFLPPAERRALILLDPPYEQPDEFERVAEALQAASRKFASGVAMAWYPIKHRAPVRTFHEAMRGSGVRDVVAAELLLREPLDAGRLNGSGLLVVNPPFGFEAAVPAILEGLLSRLGDGEAGQGTALIRLADE